MKTAVWERRCSHVARVQCRLLLAQFSLAGPSCALSVPLLALIRTPSTAMLKSHGCPIIPVLAILCKVAAMYRTRARYGTSAAAVNGVLPVLFSTSLLVQQRTGVCTVHPPGSRATKKRGAFGR